MLHLTISAHYCRHIVTTGSLIPDLNGQCVWFCPPAHNETIEAYLKHYHAQKEKYPDLTGIFVLPGMVER
jgi:hypothetical protein